MHVLYLVVQTYPSLCDPVNCSPLGSSVHGVFQAKIVERVVISFSRGSSQPRDQIHVSLRLMHRHWQAGSLPLVPPGKLWSCPTQRGYLQIQKYLENVRKLSTIPCAHHQSHIFWDTTWIWAIFSEYSAFTLARPWSWPGQCPLPQEMSFIMVPAHSPCRKPCINASAEAQVTSCIQSRSCAFSLLNSFFSGC